DWDFALYKASDCGSLGEPVRCNFFDNSDEEAFMGVGEDPTGNPETVLYEEWLQVEPGEDYYLLINNFSNTNSGFSIQFTGRIFETNPYDALDCSIIDNLLGPPVVACDNETFELDADTENADTYAWYRDTGAGYQLLAGETTSLYEVTESAMYRVVVSLDDGSSIVSDVQVAFTEAPTAFPATDETLCSGELYFDLSMKDREVLGTQDPEKVRVSYHRSLSEAVDGINVLPREHPLMIGTETIFARTTSVDNSGCFDASTQFQLSVGSSPVINFETDVYICESRDAIVIGDLDPNPDYSYSWSTGENSPAIGITNEGTYSVLITNTADGLGCETTVTVEVVVSLAPKITEVIIDDLRPENSVEIITDITGEFEYQMDDGPFQPDGRFTDVVPGIHTVTINDIKGCGQVTETITVVGYVKFFTPNGDGVNDEWEIVGLDALQDPELQIFDRYGKVLRVMGKNSTGWNGTYQGHDLPAADYWFRLTYTDPRGQRVEAKYLDAHFSLTR
uniref:T9SS type B sorting domain-containing protein n=1 Tax=Zeaxanthinibacter enoshimensis TaxID=392009 RepID=UPI003567EEEB